VGWGGVGLSPCDIPEGPQERFDRISWCRGVALLTRE